MWPAALTTKTLSLLQQGQFVNKAKLLFFFLALVVFSLCCPHDSCLSSQGLVVVWELHLERRGRPERVSVSWEHRGQTITALCWDTSTLRVFVGDSGGKVTSLRAGSSKLGKVKTLECSKQKYSRKKKVLPVTCIYIYNKFASVLVIRISLLCCLYPKKHYWCCHLYLIFTCIHAVFSCLQGSAFVIFPVQTVTTVDSRVVQLGCQDGRLLVSSLSRCYLADTERSVTAWQTTVESMREELIQRIPAE